MSPSNNNKLLDDDFVLAVIVSGLIIISRKVSQPLKNFLYNSKSVADKIFLIRTFFGDLELSKTVDQN